MSADIVRIGERAAIRTAERIIRECRANLHQPRPKQSHEHLLNVLSLVLVTLLESFPEYDEHPKSAPAVIARMLAVMVADLEDAGDA